MATDPERYLPPHISQRETKLAIDGVDDCLVVSGLALVNAASLGEATQRPTGHEATARGLVRVAVRMRDRLAKDKQTGGLDFSDGSRMVALEWPEYPALTTDDIDFPELVARLKDGHVAVLAGNPSRIARAGSPLHRVGDVGHAIALLRARDRANSTEILTDDPYREAGINKRGEWLPAKDIRQFAYRDSDKTLTAVWTERYGAWTAEANMRRAKNRRIGKLVDSLADAGNIEARLRARIAALEAGQPVDCSDAVAAEHERTLVAAIDKLEAMRAEQ